MTNKSLRERFGLENEKSAVVSQIIAIAIAEDLIKMDQTIGDSKKMARYLPFWA